MKTIKVGGVPEHFNLPWHLCIEEGDFKYENLQVEWRDFPDGTGAMNKALRNGEIDVAVILTEGIIKDISAGNPSRIIQEYIASPLIWGIHVAADSKYQSLPDLKGTTAAISRIGSGSQLMAYVNAENNSWRTDDLKFEIVGDIDGAINALQEDRAQYFMWERFTTKPLVDKGIFRRIADCPTPWSCFVIAAREEFIYKNEPELEKMLNVLNAKSVSFKEIVNIDRVLSERYGQKIEDIQNWMELTSWSQHQISEGEVQKVQETLYKLKLVEEKLPALKFIHNFGADSV